MPNPDPSRRSEKSRRAVLTAAFELVQEVPYAQLTIEGIAGRAGVGKQTIYRWWPSKAAILFDAFLLLSRSDDGATPELPDTGDLRRDLAAVLHATVAELTDPGPTRRCARSPSRSPRTPPSRGPTTNDSTARCGTRRSAGCGARRTPATSPATSTSTSRWT
nr:hypothetical protein GCM10025730_01460 [Promicromonospora thailandica]